jgi:hypothetical protein
MRSFRAATGAIVSVVLFSALNYREWLRAPGCADCRFPRGVPFAYYREDAFYGGAGIVWSGLFGDIAVCLMSAAIVAWLTDSIWRKITAVQ